MRGGAGHLTNHEPLELATYETMDRGLQTFTEVGLALAAIHERRLYRVTHSSFRAYVQERWGLSNSTAFRKIAAARTLTVLEEAGWDVPK